MLEIKDTALLMTSENYKERFIAEYWQTKNRYEKLKVFNTRIEASHRSKECFGLPKEKMVEMPKHDCPDDLLIQQQNVMGEYLHLLELRAIIEDIDLFLKV